MRTSHLRARTALALLAGVLLAGLTGLAMAAPGTGFGADLLARWLVGWFSAALVLVPVAIAAVRPRQRAQAPRRATASLPFRTRRLG